MGTNGKAAKATEKQKPNSGHENIKPHMWKKGQSGNPKGRPKKGKRLTDIIEKYLPMVPEIDENPDGKTYQDLIAEALLIGAVKGNAVLIKEVLDRVDGKVPLPVTGKVKGSIGFKVVNLTGSNAAKELFGGDIPFGRN